MHPGWQGARTAKIIRKKSSSSFDAKLACSNGDPIKDVEFSFKFFLEQLHLKFWDTYSVRHKDALFLDKKEQIGQWDAYKAFNGNLSPCIFNIAWK